jgi:hypothetical protein
MMTPKWEENTAMLPGIFQCSNCKIFVALILIDLGREGRLMQAATSSWTVSSKTKK